MPIRWMSGVEGVGWRSAHTPPTGLAWRTPRVLWFNGCGGFTEGEGFPRDSEIAKFFICMFIQNYRHYEMTFNRLTHKNSTWKGGDEPLTIAWSLHGDTISSDPDIITTALGTRSSILTISKVGYRHAGDYTCRASNVAGSYSHTAQLRVNG